MRCIALAALMALGCAAASTTAAPSGLPFNEASESDEDTSEQPDTVSYAAVAGTWNGIGSQDDGSTWELEMTLYEDAIDDGVIGAIVYPTLQCASVLVRVDDESDDDELVMRERLTEGHEVCADDGVLRLRILSDDALDWRWSYSDGREGATATVRRVE